MTTGPAAPIHPDDPQAPHPGQSHPGDAAATAEAQAPQSKWAMFLHAMHPKTLWSMADGYPVVLKQFIQFCLVIIYPAWVFTVLFSMVMTGLFYVTVYPVLWVLFWPMRAWMKKNRPEEYAQSRRR